MEKLNSIFDEGNKVIFKLNNKYLSYWFINILFFRKVKYNHIKRNINKCMLNNKIRQK